MACPQVGQFFMVSNVEIAWVYADVACPRVTYGFQRGNRADTWCLNLVAC